MPETCTTCCYRLDRNLSDCTPPSSAPAGWPLEGSVSVVKGVVRAYKFGWEGVAVSWLPVWENRVEKKVGKNK